jgi:hypothetical protein
VLYPRLLDRDFEKLPRVLREFHTLPGGGRASGTVDVRHSRAWLATLIGFPPPGNAIRVELQVLAGEDTAGEDREIWMRSFGGVKRRSVQTSKGGLLLESAGPIRMAFRLHADQSGMRFELQYARLWMLPLPLRIEAQVWGRDSSWEFLVTVAGVGSYRGTMVPGR